MNVEVLFAGGTKVLVAKSAIVKYRGFLEAFCEGESDTVDLTGVSSSVFDPTTLEPIEVELLVRAAYPKDRNDRFSNVLMANLDRILSFKNDSVKRKNCLRLLRYLASDSLSDVQFFSFAYTKLERDEGVRRRLVSEEFGRAAHFFECCTLVREARDPINYSTMAINRWNKGRMLCEGDISENMFNSVVLWYFDLFFERGRHREFTMDASILRASTLSMVRKERVKDPHPRILSLATALECFEFGTLETVKWFLDTGERVIRSRETEVLQRAALSNSKEKIELLLHLGFKPTKEVVHTAVSAGAVESFKALKSESMILEREVALELLQLSVNNGQVRMVEELLSSVDLDEDADSKLALLRSSAYSNDGTTFRLLASHFPDQLHALIPVFITLPEKSRRVMMDLHISSVVDLSEFALDFIRCSLARDLPEDFTASLIRELMRPDQKTEENFLTIVENAIRWRSSLPFVTSILAETKKFHVEFNKASKDAIFSEAVRSGDCAMAQFIFFEVGFVPSIETLNDLYENSTVPFDDEMRSFLFRVLGNGGTSTFR